MALICYCVYRILCDICVLCRSVHVFFSISIIFTFLSTHFGTCIYKSQHNTFDCVQTVCDSIALLTYFDFGFDFHFSSFVVRRFDNFPSNVTYHTLEGVVIALALTAAMDECCAFFVVAPVIPAIREFHVQLPGHRLALALDA